MTDYGTMLEQDLRRVAPPRFGLDELTRARERRTRNRRIGATVVAAIAFAAIIGYFAVSVGPRGKQPLTGTSRAPTRIGVVTIDSAGCTLDGTTDLAAGPYTLEVINETDRDKTVVVFKIPSDERFARMLAFVGRTHPAFGTAGSYRSPDHVRVQARFFEYANTSETDISAHESIVLSEGLDGGTYGIQCAGRAPERDRRSDFVGPIDVRSGTG